MIVDQPTLLMTAQACLLVGLSVARHTLRERDRFLSATGIAAHPARAGLPCMSKAAELSRAVRRVTAIVVAHSALDPLFVMPPHRS